jgi:hypothetical protein
MRKCSNCGIDKTFDEFCKDKSKKDGLRKECKKCKYEKEKAYRQEHPEKQIKYRQDNKEKIKLAMAKYRQDNKEKRKKSNKIWREKNTDKLRERHKEWALKNPDKRAKAIKNWHLSNPEKNKEAQKRYYQKHKSRIYKYRANKKLNDPLFALSVRIRQSISKVFRRRGYTKRSATATILGCTFEEFKIYIEVQFVDGMSWENRSEWHIDHKIPASSAKTEEALIALNHYTNLQPLWALDNMKKGKKLDNE